MICHIHRKTYLYTDKKFENTKDVIRSRYFVEYQTIQRLNEKGQKDKQLSIKYRKLEIEQLTNPTRLCCIE